VELRSSVLGRNAQFQRTRRVVRLPRYLIVQFVRFFWRNDTQKKAKILRKVQYPLRFDILPYTDIDLRASLTYVRSKLKEEQDKKLGLEEKLKEEKLKEEKAKNEEKDKDKPKKIKLQKKIKKKQKSLELKSQKKQKNQKKNFRKNYLKKKEKKNKKLKKNAISLKP